MSEGEPTKRQKISENQEVSFSEDGNLKYQNACLGARLKEQRKQISELTSTNEKLTQKLQSLEDYITNFNSSWSKVQSI